ncbi:MAG: tetratricopeptide repeat protein [Bacteroidetes bacterium]|nr:MAG: tetratricopeptide repeat protein [Bacteroidota bacterium]
MCPTNYGRQKYKNVFFAFGGFWLYLRHTSCLRAMTENELTHLQTHLQQLLNKQNYADLFKELAKCSFLQGYMTFYLEFTGGSFKTDALFVQRFKTFLNGAFEEEREKLHIQLDETILKKEQEKARLDKEISEKKKIVEALNQQIAEAKTQLASLPASYSVNEASKNLSAAISDNEVEAQAWFWKSKTLPNHSDKILVYDKAIACKPDFAEAYFWRGKVKKALRKHQEAITDFTKAIEYKPDFAEAYFERGCTKSIYLSRYQESLADFTQAILINPKHGNAYFSRGLAKQNLTMYQEAIIDYQQHLQIRKTDSTAWEGIAECYSMLQDKQNTLKYLAEAIKLYPNYKQQSKKNENFEWLWEDTDFKRLVG